MTPQPERGDALRDTDDEVVNKETGPLKELGIRLTELLDDDQWNNLEPLLIQAIRERTSLIAAAEAAALELLKEKLVATLNEYADGDDLDIFDAALVVDGIYKELSKGNALAAFEAKVRLEEAKWWHDRLGEANCGFEEATRIRELELAAKKEELCKTDSIDSKK